MEMQYMTGSYNNLGEDAGANSSGGPVVSAQNMTSNSKGDISQQIMDSPYARHSVRSEKQDRSVETCLYDMETEFQNGQRLL